MGFYAGVQVKVLQDVIRCVAFFYVFSTLKRAYRRRFGKISMAANLLLGYLAATFNLAITMPVEVANTRMITGASKSGLLATWAEVIRCKGLAGLYCGFASNLVLCLNPAIKHMVFDKARAGLLKGRRSLSTAEAFWLGVLATVLATSATFPFIRSRAVMQSFRSKKKGDGPAGGGGAGEAEEVEVAAEEAPSHLDIIRDIVRRQGAAGLYKGLTAQLMKGTLASGFLLATKERVLHATEIVVKSVVSPAH